MKHWGSEQNTNGSPNACNAFIKNTAAHITARRIPSNQPCAVVLVDNLAFADAKALSCACVEAFVVDVSSGEKK